MKKITYSMVALFSGLMISPVAYPVNLANFNVCVPAGKGDFIFGITGLYLRPSVPELDYALTFPAIEFIGTTPATIFENGTYRSVDPEYDWGYEAFIGYEFPCSGNDIRLTYRHTDFKNDTDTIVAPAILASLIDITFFNGSAVDGVTSAVFNSFARGDSNFDYDIWDADLGQRIRVGCHTTLRFFGGVRYARLDHKFHANYVQHLDGVSITATPFTEDDAIDIFQKSRFNGIGPRFGLDLNYLLCGGFGIVGHSSGALIIGNDKSSLSFDTFLRDASEFGADETTTHSFYRFPSETRVVPNLEARLGLAYGYQFCNKTQIIIEAGWMVDHYWNTIDRLAVTAFETPEFRTRHTLDTSFDGPYATLQVHI